MVPMTGKITRKDQPTYEDEVLGILAYEFFFSDKAEIEKKIKRHLREKKLGGYDPERVEILRAFKNDVQEEIGKGDQSKYFTGFHGRYAGMKDFDTKRFCEDMYRSHPQVPESEIAGFLGFAIYLYYLR